MLSSSQVITTNKPTPNFLQARCPSCHPTNSVKALKSQSELLSSVKVNVLGITLTVIVVS